MLKPFSFTVVSVPFVLLHLACLAALWLAFSWKLAALGVAVYLVHRFVGTDGLRWCHKGWALSDGRT